MAEQGILRCRDKAMFASDAKRAYSTQEREVPTSQQWSHANPISIPNCLPPTKPLDKKKKVVYINTTIVGIVGGMLP